MALALFAFAGAVTDADLQQLEARLGQQLATLQSQVDLLRRENAELRQGRAPLGRDSTRDIMGSGLAGSEGRRLSPATQRTMWHNGFLHRFDVPASSGCGLEADLHTSSEPLMIRRGQDGNLTMQYSTGAAFITNAPVEVTHPSGCATKTLTANAHVEVTGDLMIEGDLMIHSMNADAAGQPANTNLVQLSATPPALSADDVGANNLMGLMLRFAAMSTAGTIKSAKSDTKVMDMNHADGTSPGVMHMSDLHGRLNQHFFWMGPYIISLFDPDCVGTDATNNKAPEQQPTCVLQPYRLLDGGTPLCLTWGDGTAAATTAAVATCPADPNNAASHTDGDLSACSCLRYRFYLRPCTIGTTNLWQQFKIKPGSEGQIQPMASSSENCCMDYDDGAGQAVWTWACSDNTDGQKWKYYR